MSSAWTDNVEVVDLKADKSETTGVDTKETSFTHWRPASSQSQKEGQPVPPPRNFTGKTKTSAKPHRLKPLEPDDNSENKILTPESVPSQGKRLGPSSEERASVSSRRQSVSGWSLGSTNDQSDTGSRSYRERLRERIQTVKEQAGSSVNARLKHTLKIKSPVAHFHDLIGREESEVEAALEKHGETRKKWKNVMQASLEAENAHNFFTKEWDSEQLAEVDCGTAHKGEVVGGGEEDTSEGDQVKLVTKDYLGLADEWQLVGCFVDPIIEDPSLQVHQESQLYFFPSDQPVTLEDKLGPNCTPRYIEEEGFYVGPKPTWSTKSHNKLQQRLIMEGRRHWFDEDGELKTILKSNEEQYSDSLLAPVYRNAEMISLVEPNFRHEDVMRATYLLELEVGSISWLHHPLCSTEHVAAHQLVTLHQQYSGRVRAGLGRRLANKLQALRTARDNARRTGLTDQYCRYKSQVKQTRELRLEEGRRDRLATVSCLKAWLALRTLRIQQGYRVTPVKLSIVELEANVNSDMFGCVNEWESELKHQVAECIEEAEDSYKNKLDELKTQQISKEGVETEVVAIQKRSSSEIVEDVKSRLAESLRSPAEPIILLELGDEPITPEAEITSSRELERRAAQKRCQLTVRLLCNKRTVCQTRPHSLYPHFISSFNQKFTLQVSDWPQSLSLELVMEGGIGAGKRLSATVFVPVPYRSTTLAGAPLDSLEFNSPDKLGPYTHDGVGCGVPDQDGSVHFSGGLVTCRVGWGDQGGPPQSTRSTSCRTPLKLLNTVESMREWASRAHLDPNDPANAELFQYIKGESNNKDYVNDQIESLPNGDFCTMEDIENNPRLKLLSLRNQMVPEFRDIRNIPLRDREIPDDIFKMYEKRVQSPVRSAPGVGETAVEWQREWSRQQLALIRDNIVQHCRQTQQHHSLREVVLEDQVPDMGTLGLTFMKWLQPKRPLRPTRKERKKFPAMGLVGQEVEIIVNVVRAFEVPVRMDIDPLLENGLSLVPVRPFVEVSFQNHKSRTTTAEGANPTWNQDLRIPVKLPSGGLVGVQDRLYCQLYDETVLDLLEDDRQRETNIHQRLQRQWLGSLHIPFSSLCSNSRIEGTFQLYSPPVLLGYQRESLQRQTGSPPAGTSGLRDSTFLTLFITVHPPLHPPEPFKERLPCSELPHVEQHLEQWQAQVASQFPHRPVKCLVVDTSAKSVCVTRFFHPLDPPVLEEGEPTTPDMALRFVSKIPKVPGSMLFPGLFDVWLIAQQVVTLLSGDCETLAVLLCCYLQSLGQRAWLLLGAGSHGPTALVLSRDLAGGSVLWDPASGQRFNPCDSFCPLQCVYCLINQDNIWANIQREEVVSRTRFDVTRRSDWWPAFNRSVATPLGSVQPAELQYTGAPTLATDTALLRDKLEKTLRDYITKWRPTTRTIWNRYVTLKLRKLLPGLEKSTWSNNSSVSAEHINQLSQTLSGHKMCGFTQNFTFTSIEEIVEAVKATGIHTIESSDVEFALAVYVHPFVCGVLSVWVYVTSLTPRR